MAFRKPIKFKNGLNTSEPSTFGNLFVTGGNIGINNTAPGYDLDVTGDINLTGQLFQSGSLFTTSQWTGSIGNSLSYTSGAVIMSNTSVGNLTATSSLITNSTITNINTTTFTGTNLLTSNITAINIIATNETVLSLLATGASATNLTFTTISAGSATATIGTVVTTNINTVNETVSSLLVTDATASTLSFTTVSAGSATATIGNIIATNINATNQTISSLLATGASATNLAFTTVSAGSATATIGNIVATNLTTTNETVTSLFATGASVTNLAFTTVSGASSTATIGNIIATNLTTTNESVSSLFATGVSATNLAFTTVSAGSATATIGNIVAINVNITNETVTSLFATGASVTNLAFTTVSGASSTATIGTIVATDINTVNQTVSSLFATGASATNLSFTTVSAGSATATIGTIVATDINTVNQTVSSLFATGASVTNLAFTTVSAGSATATIGTVVATNINTVNETVSSLFATGASATNLSFTTVSAASATATIGNIINTNLTTTSLLATNITATNITVLNLQAVNETVTNLTVVNESIQNLIVTNDVSVSDNLIALGNSNTVGNIFTTGGNVGIGTTSPTSLLTVNGNITASNLGISSITTVSLFATGASVTNLAFTTISGASSTATIGTIVATDINTVNQTVSSLFATGASATNLSFTTVSAGSATATIGTIVATDINTVNQTVSSLFATGASVTNLAFTTVSAGSATATIGTIVATDINTVNQTVSSLFATGASLTNLAFTTVSAGSATATIGTVVATDINTVNETVSSLFATGASVTNLAFTTISGASSTATIGNIISNDISVSDNLIAFGNSNTVGAIITTGGNVGINTINPIGKMHTVMDSATANGAPVLWDSTYSVFGQASATGGAVGLGYHAVSGGSLSSISPNVAWRRMVYRADSHNFFASGDFQRMIINNSGNVGIGNPSPNYDLDVTGDVNFTGTLYQNGTPFSGGGGSSQWTGSVGSLISYTSGNVLISNASIESITIANGLVTGDLTITGNSLKAISNSNTVGAIFTTGGNVGIGTTSPSVKLDVAGGLRVTGGSLIASSNSNTIGSLFTTFITSGELVPVTSGLFAYYNGSSWNGSQWTDLTTNGNHATTIGGTINTTVENSITYIYGDTNSSIRFPTSVLPNTYTLFHVAKLNGSNKARIFDGVSNNWLSGFWGGYSGVAWHSNDFLGGSPPTTGVQNSTNWVLSSDQKGLYRANGSFVGTIGNGQTAHLSIQDSIYNETSDWAVSEVIVYNRELTNLEIEEIESWLMDKYSAFTFTTSLTYSTTYTAGTVTLSSSASFVVGINNTAPSYLLDVNGDLNFTGDLYQNGSIFNAPNVWTGSMGSSISYTGGNVGIGTATPKHTLDIQKQNVKVGIRATAEGETATLYLGTPHLGGDVFKSAIIAQGVGGWSRNYLHFCLNDNSNSNDSVQNASLVHSRMTITYDGNVGIANTSPSYKLDVGGNINFTGDLYKNGSLFNATSQWNGSVGNTISYTSGNVVANRLVIETSGNFGITTTTTSANYLYFGITSGSSNTTEPNVALTSASDGGYVVSASSNDYTPEYSEWKTFDKNSSTGWHTANLYNPNYFGSVSTTLANATVYEGEWIQLQIPSSLIVRSMKITPRSSLGNRAPKDFILVGSTSGNNSSWVTLYSDTGVTWGNSGSESARTFTMTTTGSYNYYRLIINQIDGNYINIMDIEFYTESLAQNYPNAYLGKRIYSGTRGSELLLFKGNDSATTEIDRIRLLSTEHRFDTASVYGTFNQVATSGTTRMLIASSGNVGIGNTTPGYNLDVTGDINFTGNLYQNGTLFSGAGSPVYITRSAQTTGAQTISSGSNVLLFPDVGQSSGNIIYNTAGTFTVNDTGLYSVYVDIDVYNADDIIDLYILKNNTEDTINGRIAWRNISLDDAASINALVYLEENDYITVIVNNTSANSFVTPYAGSKVNSFGMSLLNSSSGAGSGSQWTGSVGNPISYTSGTTIMSNASISNITIANGLVTGDLTITGNSLKAISNSNTIGSLFTTSVTSTTGLVPVTSGLFAYYNGSSWTGTQWSDLTTNGNHATTIGGTINTTTQNSITYIYGNTNSSIRFPTSVLPSTYTFFHVAKYNGTNFQRIFDGVTNNWLSGFHIDDAGVAYHEAWVGPEDGVKFSTNWLLSSDQKGLYRANGTLIGTIGNGQTTHLSVQDGQHSNENSDWAISEVIVYNRELTNSEIEQMESWLMDKYSAFTFTTSFSRSNTYTTGTVTLSTTANFFVGIGNTAPSYLLDVNGDINFTGDIYQNGSLFSAGSGGSSSQWTGSVGSTISYTSGTVIMTDTSISNLSSMNVSVGNRNISGANGSVIIGKNNGAGGNRSFKIGYNENFDLTIGDFMTNWTETFKINYAAPAGRFYIDNNGNIGFGTTSPSTNFDFLGNVNITKNDFVTLNLQNTATPAQTKIYSFTDTRSYFQTYGDLLFTGIDSDQLRGLCIRTSGNVGIGTTSPSQNLTVNGNIQTNRIYYSDQPFFRVTDPTGGSVGTVGDVTFSTVLYQSTTPCWNTTSNLFTAPVTGLYQFDATFLVNYGNSITDFIIILRKNTSTDYRIFQNGIPIGDTGQDTCSGSILLKLDANDTIKMLWFFQNARPTSIAGSDTFSWFTGRLVG